jgi:hypothetical protein
MTIDEKWFAAALGDEIKDMPHDFDSLETWARGFLERYETARIENMIGMKDGDARCSDCRSRFGVTYPIPASPNREGGDVSKSRQQYNNELL